MEIYKNLGGTSNVRAYSVDQDSITIEFMSGANRFYVYDQNKPGMEHVNRMKALAVAGQGLNSYIGTHLRSPNSYSSKW